MEEKAARPDPFLDVDPDESTAAENRTAGCERRVDGGLDRIEREIGADQEQRPQATADQAVARSRMRSW